MSNVKLLWVERVKRALAAGDAASKEAVEGLLALKRENPSLTNEQIGAVLRITEWQVNRAIQWAQDGYPDDGTIFEIMVGHEIDVEEEAGE